MGNILKDIEAYYPVEKLLVNGYQVWSYLRVRCNSMYRAKEASRQGERGTRYPSLKRTRKQGLMQKLMYKLGVKHIPAPLTRFAPLIERARRLARNLKQMPMPILKRVLGPLQTARKLQVLYGFRNWFSKYEYVVLSISSERRELNGKLFHKLIDPVADRLGHNRVLYIENGSPSLCPIEEVHSKHIVPQGLLLLLARAVVCFTPAKCKFQHKVILESIMQDYGIQFDYVRWIRLFNARRKVFSLLFRIIRPRVVFVTDYISYSPAVKAAKELGIKVVEFQHGTIGKEHPSYNIDVELDRTCFPDYLLVFGRRELETFASSHFIEGERVLPIGSFYVEHVRNNHKPDDSLVKQLKSYNRTVGVTLQWTYERRTIDFIVLAAELDPNVFYILIPRLPVAKGVEEAKHAAAGYHELKLPRNVAVITDKNFYELMMYVDFHATMYSTSALEAPSLGAQNILINIDNMSQKYFGTFLRDKRTTRYVNTPEQFVHTVNTFRRLTRDAVCKLNQDIVAMDYERNMEKVINTYVLNERDGCAR
jgi:hypothetical protein